MKGNSMEHPNAYLIFRIFVDSIKDQALQENKKAESVGQAQEETKRKPQKDSPVAPVNAGVDTVSPIDFFASLSSS